MKKNTVGKSPADGTAIVPEHVHAPVAQYVPPAPRQKRVERQGSKSEPYVRHWPDVRGGTCEFCGVIDHNFHDFQYKLCPHYRGLELRCSYCPESKIPQEVNKVLVLQVMEHPDNPDEFICCCNLSECAEKHIARFQRNR